MRINKYISATGYCSRRKADKLIKEKKVKVNGKIVSDFSLRISDETVMVNNKIIQLPEKKVVYAYNKPIGVTVSMSDPKQDNLIADKIKDIKEKLLPIGRLDKDSSGLLLLSNDGDLIHRLTHPSYEKPKTYHLKLDRFPTENEIKLFEKGIPLDGRITSPAKIINKKPILEITIKEGRNRQLRRMWEYFNYEVLSLKRIKIDNISLCNLKEGEFRKLSQKEIDSLWS